MVADLVALFGDLARSVRPRSHLLADLKEGRLHVMLTQNFEDPGRAGGRSVVKREGYYVAAGLATPYRWSKDR
jgi:hypothetical protein